MSKTAKSIPVIRIRTEADRQGLNRLHSEGKLGSGYDPTEPPLSSVMKSNPYHDASGAFTSKDKAAGKKGKVTKVSLSNFDKSAEFDTFGVNGEGETARIGVALVESLTEDFKMELSSAPSGAVGIELDSQNISIKRIFYRKRDRLIVDHTLFTVMDDFQGQNIGKDLMRAQLREYDRLGVHEVKAHANVDVGGYAWARYGFKAQQPESLASSLRSKLVEMIANNKLTEEEGAVLDTILAKNRKDAKLPWLISDSLYNGKKIGKELLLGSDWHGVLDLKDKETRDRLKRYLG
jgi:GNAT superfamily N-acetyltransferase